MGNLSQSPTPNQTASPRPLGRASLRKVFVADQGIRSGWSALIFVVLFLALDAAVTAVLVRFVTVNANAPIPLGIGLLQESCQLLVVFAATAAMARIEKRPLLSYGFTDSRKLFRLGTGVLL